MAIFILKTQPFLLITLALGAQVSSRYFQETSSSQSYTNNPICSKRSCVNPITPGLTELPRLEELVWQCTASGDVKKYSQFCKEHLFYDAAIPSPSNKSVGLDALVFAQEQAASTMFIYHLSALGYEGWDFKEQGNINTNGCVRSIQQMVCLTYFPKAKAYCQAGEQTPYSRPCKNACELYMDKCKVECCDGSNQCVFSQTTETGTNITGYVDADGPSALCTGGGSNRLGVPMTLLLFLIGMHSASAEFGSSEPSQRAAKRGGFSQLLVACVLVFCCVSLQGCFLTIPEHNTPAWLSKTNYLVKYEYIPPGQSSASATLNSCSPGAAARQVCSGRGECALWSGPDLTSSESYTTQVQLATFFCKCDAEWADPECKTRRKSQLKAFAWSMVFGVFGADHFYLGLVYSGLAKLFVSFFVGLISLVWWSQVSMYFPIIGLGTWWIFDVVRTGCAPVYASDFRVYNDLPHWVFVLTVTFLFAAGGLIYSLDSYVRYRKLKRAEVMKMHERDEDLSLPRAEDMDKARFRGFSGYGATTQQHR